MLEQFKKFFTAQAETTAPAVQQEETLMVDETGQTELAAGNDNTAELTTQMLTAQFATVSDALVANQAALAELNTKFADAMSKLAEIEDAKAVLIAEAKNKQLAYRKEKVELAFGTSKAVDVLAATAALDDTQFESIISAMTSVANVEANSEMFIEIGVSAEATPAPEESREMQIIKAKQAALAAFN